MLGVPILSIDYNLAPQAPYPRAMEETLYAYAWALKHASTLLGSTAKKVVFAGKKKINFTMPNNKSDRLDYF